MKTVFKIIGGIVVILVILFFITRPSEAEIQREAFIHDSISRVVRDRMDNPPNKYSEKESTTIYGDVKFGMSKDEYDKLIPSNSNEIAGHSFLFSPSFGSKDEIYNLSISGYDKTANYIDTKIVDEIALLYSVISEKYGEPHLNFGKVKFFDLKPGYSFWQYGWDIDDKRIRIGMSEDSRGSRYSSILSIWSNKAEKELKKLKTDEKLDNIKDESSKF